MLLYINVWKYMKKIKKENLEEIINMQFKVAWHNNVTFNDLVGNETWFHDYSTTEEKEKEFKEWLIKYLIPFTWKNRAKKEACKLILNYWLIIKQNVESD